MGTKGGNAHPKCPVGNEAVPAEETDEQQAPEKTRFVRGEEPGCQCTEGPGESRGICVPDAASCARRRLPSPDRSQDAGQVSPLRIPQVAKRQEHKREQGRVPKSDRRAALSRKLLETECFNSRCDDVSGVKLARKQAALAKAVFKGGGLRAQGRPRAILCDLREPQRLVPGEDEIPVLQRMQEDPGFADAAGMNAGCERCRGHHQSKELLRGIGAEPAAGEGKIERGASAPLSVSIGQIRELGPDANSTSCCRPPRVSSDTDPSSTGSNSSVSGVVRLRSFMVIFLLGLRDVAGRATSTQ